MKFSFTILGVLLLVGVAQAGQFRPSLLGSPYDVVVPVLTDDPASGSRVAGQLYFNVAGSSFNGIDNNGNVVTLAFSVGNVVTSGSSDRIERIRVTSDCTSSPCTIASQSGSWVSSVTRNSTGNYTLNINSGIFSAAPTCNVLAGNTANLVTFRQVAATTSTSFQFLMANYSNFAALDGTFDVICMGPR